MKVSLYSKDFRNFLQKYSDYTLEVISLKSIRCLAYYLEYFYQNIPSALSYI